MRSRVGLALYVFVVHLWIGCSSQQQQVPPPPTGDSDYQSPVLGSGLGTVGGASGGGSSRRR